MTDRDPVPALARTDVPPLDLEALPAPRPRRAGRALAIGLAVLAAAALLVFGILFAMRHDLLDPALVSSELFDAWR